MFDASVIDVANVPSVSVPPISFPLSKKKLLFPMVKYAWFPLFTLIPEVSVAL